MPKSPQRNESPLSRIIEKEAQKPATPLNQWAEEQRANVKQTYLRPFKLLKSGEVVQKYPQKSIKSNKTLGFPIVTKVKEKSFQEPLFAGQGRGSVRDRISPRRQSNFTQSHQADRLLSKDNSVNYRDKQGMNTANPDEGQNDEILEQDSGRIINLKFGQIDLDKGTQDDYVNPSRRSSGENRY